MLRGLEISRQLLTKSPLVGNDRHRALQLELGHVERVQGRLNEAIASYEKTLRLTEEQFVRVKAGSPSSAYAYEGDRVMIQTALAETHRENGNWRAAMQWLTSAIEALEARQGVNESDEVLMRLTQALTTRAFVFSDDGNQERMNSDFSRALSAAADYMRKSPDNRTAAHQHAAIQSDWGAALANAGHTDKAMSRYSAAKAEFEKLVKSYPNSVDVNTGHAMVLFRLAEQPNSGTTWDAVADLVDDLKTRQLLAPMECRCLEKAREFATVEKAKSKRK